MEGKLERRVFFRELGAKTLGLFGSVYLLNSLNCSMLQKRKSKNWVWLTPDIETTDDEWKKRFEKLKKAGFDAIIPEIYNGRWAYFSSTRLPVREELLERLIPIAKSSGLEIHAWMWAMPCLVEDIQKNHPDWYNVNRLGESSVDKPAYVNYYKFLCPAKPEVHEFIQGTVSELTQYDIDGIHLDYIRFPDVILAKGLWSKYNLVQDKEYPQFDYCYCNTCREKFKDQTGTDPMTIEDPAADRSWLQFRYDLVTTLVNDKLVPIGRKAGKVMSAAVFPNWKNVRQEWRVWKLDAVFPMLYNQFYLEDAEWIKRQCVDGIKSLQYPAKLYSGLMIDEPDKFKEYVIQSFAGGARGVSIFSLRSIRDEHLQMLTGLLKRY